MKPRRSPRLRSGLAEHYRSLFSELAASGQSLRAFARERELSPWTLYAWRRRLGLARSRRTKAEGPTARSQPGPQLLEVEVRSSSASSAAPGVVVHLFGHHRLDLSPGFCEEELRRLVRVLSSC